jgi:hypothetical protein
VNHAIAHSVEERTVLNEFKVAIHRALAPTILNSENCSPKRKTAGCKGHFMFEGPVCFGSPKCEKMRSPRVSCASVSTTGLASGGSFGTWDSFPSSVAFEALDCCDEVFVEELAFGGPTFVPFALPLPEALANALASRSISCFARRSAFVVVGADFGAADGAPDGSFFEIRVGLAICLELKFLTQNGGLASYVIGSPSTASLLLFDFMASISLKYGCHRQPDPSIYRVSQLSFGG